MSRSRPLLAGLCVLVGAFLLADRFWISRHGTSPDVATVNVPPTEIPDLPVVPTVAEKSIAVLPFADLSAKQDHEYFSDGLSSGLIDQLIRVDGLQVPARTSSFHFKGQAVAVADVAAALSVTYVLEGTVRRSGNNIRVHADLVHAADGLKVWSQDYDRDVRDVFKVEDDLAGRVVAALQLAPPAAARTGGDRSASPEVLDQLLLGRHFLDPFNAAGLRRAVEAFREALRLDPGLAAGWSDLAYAEFLLANQWGDQGSAARGLDAAEHAISLAPDSASGYAVRGLIRERLLWDWAGAASDYDRVVALDPLNRLSRDRAALAAALGHAQEATRLLEQAVREDPLSAGTWSSLASLLIESGRIDEARAAAHRALDLDPDSSPARNSLAIASLLAGHPEEALPDSQAVGDEATRLTGVALAQHSLGLEPESQRALDALVRGYGGVAAFQVAEVHAWRGDRDPAFAWLDRAVTQHDAGLAQLKLDPFMGLLRSDPRYAALLRRLRLPP